MLTFLTGFIASIAHVVTGPDHLAAVTPLAIDSRRKSWAIGFSWGLGHTVGMLLIGALFIVFKEFLPVSAISTYSETTIGLLLIGIGSWALVKMVRKHSHGNRPHVHFHSKPYLYPHTHKHSHPATLIGNHSDDFFDHSHILQKSSPSKDSSPDHSHGHHHEPGIFEADHGHTHKGVIKQNALSAFFIGTIHGFAGFSHLIALLPSLAFPTLLASVIYVIAFATGTILTMIIFAFLLGFVAFQSELAKKRIFLKWFSFTGAILAIAIGALWIVHPI